MGGEGGGHGGKLMKGAQGKKGGDIINTEKEERAGKPRLGRTWNAEGWRQREGRGPLG